MFHLFGFANVKKTQQKEALLRVQKKQDVNVKNKTKMPDKIDWMGLSLKDLV
jgi:hypothetical protein